VDFAADFLVLLLEQVEVVVTIVDLATGAHVLGCHGHKATSAGDGPIDGVDLGVEADTAVVRLALSSGQSLSSGAHSHRSSFPVVCHLDLWRFSNLNYKNCRAHS
jgi:hypothetical protein